MPISLSYLASHARNLEALLQTYRQINLTTQSVFLVLGTFLLSRVLESPNLRTSLFLEFLLLSITIFSNIVMWRFQQVILARGEDVNWWHKEIVRAEQKLPPEERVFTRFKIAQSEHNLTSAQTARFLDPEDNIPDSEVDALLNADLDHIRRVINRYIIRGISLIWTIVVLLSIGSILIKVYGG